MANFHIALITHLPFGLSNRYSTKCKSSNKAMIPNKLRKYLDRHPLF